MPRVMITPAPLAGLQGEFVQVLKEAGFELQYPLKAVQMVEADLLQQMPGIQASLAGSEPYTRAVFEALTDLKVIARAGVGYDGVDVQAATDHGVVVTFAPGTNQDAVAEHCFALILGLAKNSIGQHNRIQKGEWPRIVNLPLRGTTLGLVGLGRIGKAMALLGHAFKMQVIAYEPYPDRTFTEKHGIQLMALDEVFRQADFLSLHVPATAESKHLVNQNTLALMKPSSFLINTSRGVVVNEADLYQALVEKRIAGAGLDVFQEEPPRNNPLTKLDNVVLTAHMAGVDLKSRDDMALLAARCIAQLSRGEWPSECVVNPEVKGKFRWQTA